MPSTKDRGSYLRVFLADFNNDNQLEVVGTNKGAQRPGPEDVAKSTPVSIFKVDGDALTEDSWSEQILGH